MSNLSYYEMRQEMVTVARLMWERRLTNAAEDAETASE